MTCALGLCSTAGCVRGSYSIARPHLAETIASVACPPKPRRSTDDNRRCRYPLRIAGRPACDNIVHSAGTKESRKASVGWYPLGTQFAWRGTDALSLTELDLTGAFRVASLSQNADDPGSLCTAHRTKTNRTLDSSLAHRLHVPVGNSGALPTTPSPVTRLSMPKMPLHASLAPYPFY